MKITTHNPLSKLRTFLFNSFIAVLLVFMLQACGDDDDGPTTPGSDQTVAEIAQSDDNFSELVSALESAGLVSTLQGEGPFTVFAPTNDAFGNLDIDVGNLSTEQLTEILSYHVVGQRATTADINGQLMFSALAGGELFISTASGDVVLNGSATVTDADILASNGVIHAIDQVLLPDSYLNVVGLVSKRYNLQSLEDAVVDAGLASTLQGDGPFTVFAPTNDAFANADLSGYNVEDVLTYHVLPQEVLSRDISSGSVATVNGADLEITVNNDGSVSLTDQAGNTFNVTTVDLQGTNGVVHIIDGVLLPS
jgi:transforming growth factor-beta-induced protein